MEPHISAWSVTLGDPTIKRPVDFTLPCLVFVHVWHLFLCSLSKYCMPYPLDLIICLVTVSFCMCEASMPCLVGVTTVLLLLSIRHSDVCSQMCSRENYFCYEEAIVICFSE